MLLFVTPVLADTDTQSATDHDVIVIGAGASGLAAAYFLQQQGIDTIILESQQHTGGIVQAGNKGSYQYSKSTQPYLSDLKPALKKIINELRIPLVEIPLPVRALLHDQKIYTGCSAIRQLTTSITGENNYKSFIESMNDLILHYREGGNFHAGTARAGLDLLNAAQWMKDLRIHPFIQARYNVMIRSQFGASLEDISAYSLASERLLLKASRKSSEDNHSHLWSPPKGIINITDSLTQKLHDSIHLSSTVTKIDNINDKYNIYYQHENETKIARSHSLMISTPAPVTLNIAKPVLTELQRKLLQQISYTSYVTVALYSEEPIFNSAFSLTLLKGGYITEIYDATWVERHARKNKPDDSPCILSVHLAPQNAQDKSLIDMDDNQLLMTIDKELNPLEKGVEKRISGYDIQRFPLVCPVMSPGAYHRLDQLNHSQKGVYLAGDYTIHPSFEAAVESGFGAAQKVSDWLSKKS